MNKCKAVLANKTKPNGHSVFLNSIVSEIQCLTKSEMLQNSNSNIINLPYVISYGVFYVPKFQFPLCVHFFPCFQSL